MEKEYFTLSEILDTPNTLETVVEKINLVENIASRIIDLRPERIYYIGCGSSYYAASGALTPLLLEKFPFHAYSIPASEFLFYHSGNIGNNVVIAFSRSGTTREVIEAVKIAKKNRYTTIGISCNENSELVKIADSAIVIDNCSEKSFVMTKSFTALQFTGLLLSLKMINLIEKDDVVENIVKEASKLPKFIFQALDDIDKCRILAKETINDKNFIFLGTTLTYPLAMEASLKFIEMTYSLSEPFHILEFRHGPLALAERKNDISIIMLLANDSSYKNSLKLLKEIKEKGFKVFEISNSGNVIKGVRVSWEGNNYYLPIIYAPLIHATVYYRAILKGYNPDRPEHLRKVVEDF